MTKFTHVADIQSIIVHVCFSKIKALSKTCPVGDILQILALETAFQLHYQK